MQISLFDGNTKFTINKPIRLIELFGGYGSQHFALEYLGVNFEQWKLCEWAVKSIQAYKDAHCSNDKTDYSKKLTDNEIIDYLFNKGISANYNEPMTYDQIKRVGGKKAREIYNNIMATHNLVNIQQVHGKDLEIVDTNKFCYVMTYSFPCQDLSSAGLGKGMALAVDKIPTMQIMTNDEIREFVYSNDDRTIEDYFIHQAEKELEE